MRFQTRVAFTLAAVAALGCGSDRVTGPSDEAARAAAALDRAAAEMGLDTDPGTALAYQSVAAALRGGAAPGQVQISVDGADPERWYAFAHEIRFEPAGLAGPADLFGESVHRALIAWRQTEGGAVRVVHLFAPSGQGPVGFGDLPAVVGPEWEFPSTLIYSEGRGLFWEGVRGTQTSALVRTSETPCPTPRRPAGAPAGPTCVLATFSFGFSDVEAEPAVLFRGPGSTTSAATGTRRLSMAPQEVNGMVLTIDFRTLALPTLAPAPGS